MKIQTEENPIKESIYQIKDENTVFQNIAFNYSRKESVLSYYPIEEFSRNLKNAKYFNSVESAIKRINDQYKNHKLWQLFIIFAMIFLVVEIILQKFLKS